VVAYLGDLTPSEQDDRAKLGAAAESGRLRDQRLASSAQME